MVADCRTQISAPYNLKYPVKNNEKKGLDYTRKHDLTIEELKASRLFVCFSDEQLRSIIDTIKNFTEIVYDFYQKNSSN